MSKEKNEELARLVSIFEAALAEAQTYAEANDLDLSLDFGYGMGGDWVKADKWNADQMGVEEGEFGWFTSTMSCM